MSEIFPHCSVAQSVFAVSPAVHQPTVALMHRFNLSPLPSFSPFPPSPFLLALSTHFAPCRNAHPPLPFTCFFYTAIMPAKGSILYIPSLHYNTLVSLTQLFSPSLPSLSSPGISPLHSHNVSCHPHSRFFSSPQQLQHFVQAVEGQQWCTTQAIPYASIPVDPGPRDLATRFSFQRCRGIFFVFVFFASFSFLRNFSLRL